MAEEAVVDVAPKDGAVVPDAAVEQTPNWEQEAKGYQEMLSELGYKDRDSLKKDYQAAKETSNYTYFFLKQHPEIRKQYEAFLSGEEVPKASTENKPVLKEGDKQDPFSEINRLKKELEDLKSGFEPLKHKASEWESAQEKLELQRKHKNFTDEKYSELDKRWRSLPAQRQSVLAPLSLEELARILMPEFFVESASDLRREPKGLPKSMREVGSKATATPSSLEQAKKEFREALEGATGDEGKAVANTVKKWAEEFDMSMTEAHKLLQGE
jgi:hypothetical protein